MTTLADLLHEYTAAQTYSLDLVEGLQPDQIGWRPDENSSAIGWHLGHQAAVNHFMVRNLTAAEPTLNAAFDAVFDSATPEPDRGVVPALPDIVAYRTAIASSTASIIDRIDAGDVGAPAQLQLIAQGMLSAIINHEYQHAKWVEEVRSTMLSSPAPVPASSRVVQVDGYYMVQLATS